METVSPGTKSDAIGQLSEVNLQRTVVFNDAGQAWRYYGGYVRFDDRKVGTLQPMAYSNQLEFTFEGESGSMIFNDDNRNLLTEIATICFMKFDEQQIAMRDAVRRKYMPCPGATDRPISDHQETAREKEILEQKHRALQLLKYRCIMTSLGDGSVILAGLTRGKDYEGYSTLLTRLDGIEVPGVQIINDFGKTEDYEARFFFDFTHVGDSSQFFSKYPVVPPTEDEESMWDTPDAGPAVPVEPSKLESRLKLLYMHTWRAVASVAFAYLAYQVVPSEYHQFLLFGLIMFAILKRGL